MKKVFLNSAKLIKIGVDKMKSIKENNRLTKAEKKAHTMLRNAKKAKRNIWQTKEN